MDELCDVKLVLVCLYGYLYFKKSKQSTITIAVGEYMNWQIYYNC